MSLRNPRRMSGKKYSFNHVKKVCNEVHEEYCHGGAADFSDIHPKVKKGYHKRIVRTFLNQLKERFGKKAKVTKAEIIRVFWFVQNEEKKLDQTITDWKKYYAVRDDLVLCIVTWIKED